VEKKLWAPPLECGSSAAPRQGGIEIQEQSLPLYEDYQILTHIYAIDSVRKNMNSRQIEARYLINIVRVES
jgi:hypothetical protein